MEETRKTRRELLDEVQSLRQQVASLEATVQTVQQAEVRFQTFFDTTPDYCYLISPTGTILDVNAAALTALGYTKADLLDKPLVSTIYTPEAQAKATALFAQWRATGHIEDELLTILTKTGQERLVRLSVGAVHNDDGTLRHSVSIQHDVTDTIQAEEVANQRQRRLSALLNALPESALLIRPDSRVIACNRAVAERFGYDPEALVGTDIYQILPPEVAETRREKVTEVLRAGQPTRFEDSRLGRTIDNFLNPVFDANGEIEALAVFGIDITEQRRAQVDLQRNEAKFRGIFELSPDTVLLAHAGTGRVVEANPAAAKLLEMPLEQIIGMHQTELHPPDQLEKAVEAFTHEPPLGEEAPPVEIDVLCADGSRKPVEIRGRIIDLGGEIHILGTFRDITERRQAENTLREREQFLSSIYDGISHSIFVVDVLEDGDFRYVGLNPHHEELTGISTEELSGKTPAQVLPPEAAQAVSARYRECATRGQSIVYEEWLPFRGEDLLWQTTLYPVKDEEGTIHRIIGTSQHITKQRRTEEALRQTNETNKAILDAMPDLMFVLSPDGTILDFHTSNALDLVLEPIEVAGHNIAASMPPDVSSLILSHNHRALETGELQRFEYALPVRRGTQLFECRMVRLDGDKTLSIVRNITEQRRTEDALRKSEEKYRVLFESFPLGITVSDEAGNILETNATAENLLNLSKAEHEQRDLDGPEWRIIRPDGTLMPPEEYASVVALNEKRQVNNVEMGIVKDEDLITWINVTAAPLPLEDHGVVVAYGDITPLKEAEAALQESEERFRLLVEAAPVSVLLLRQGKYVYANPAAMRMLGYTKVEEVEGLDALQTIDPAYHQPILERMRRVQERKNNPPMEMAVVRPGGEVVHTLSASVSVQLDGEPTAVIVSQDISDLKKAEALLRQKELEYRTIADFTYDWETWENPDGSYRYVSPACERVSGYSPAEFMENPSLFREIILPEDQPKWDAHHHHATDLPLKERIEFRIRRKDGQIRWIEHACRTLSDDAGNFLGYRSSNRNFTDRKVAEEALRQNEIRYRTLFERANDAIYLIDSETKAIVDCNERAASMLGYSLDELKQLHFTDIRPPEEVDAAYGELAFTAEKGRKHNTVGLHHRHCDGRLIPVEINAGTVFVDEQKLVLAIVRDVSERVEQEKALRQSRRELQRTLAATTDGIWIWHFATNQLEFSPRYYSMLGYEPDEFPASYESWVDLIHPDDRQSALATAEAYLGHKTGVYINEFRLRTKSGEYRHIHAVGRVIERDTEGEAVRMIGNHEDVTEQREAEERVKHNADNLRQITDTMQETVSVISLNGDFLFANKNAARNMSGEENASIVGKNIRELLPSNQADNLVALYRTIYESGEPFNQEIIVSLPKGDTWFANTLKPIEYDISNTPAILSVSLDITDRKEAEDSLRTKEQAIASSLNGIALADINGYLTYVNKVFLQLWGYRSETEVLGKLSTGFWEFEREARAVVEALRTSGSWQGEMTARRKDGSSFEAHLSASIVKDKAGQPIGMMAAFEDITDQKRYQARLEEYAQRLSLATQAARIGIWDWDLNTGVVVWDELSLEVYSIAPEDFTGQYDDWANAVHPDDLPAANEAVQAALDGKKPFHHRFRVVHPSGEIHTLEGQAIVQRDDDGKPQRMIGVNFDVTEQIELIQENERLQYQFYQSQKMESIGMLAGGIAHDFNNLLVPIIGFAELGMAALGPDTKLYNNFKQIKKSGESAASLTQQILAFSRQQVMEMKVVDINKIITNFQRMLHRLIGEDISMNIELSGLIKPVLADAAQIEQILLNLAVNAREAMPKGGELTIATATTYLDEESVGNYGELEVGHYVLISVTDTGAGMDTDTKERIFEPFFTTKDRGQGTGLGLATVFGIIKQHQGIILVESEPGQGSTFEIYLPVCAEPYVEDGEKTNQDEPLAGTETILVVEDEPEVRRFVCDVLQSFGYRVLEAEGPEVGIDLARAEGLNIDLLLTDVVMPVMSGSDLYQHLAAEIPSLKVMFMSGYAQDLDLKDEQVLRKPFTPQTLLTQIKGAFGIKSIRLNMDSKEVICEREGEDIS